MSVQEWLAVFGTVGAALAGTARALWGWYKSERDAERELRTSQEKRSEERTTLIVAALTENSGLLGRAATALEAQAAAYAAHAAEDARHHEAHQRAVADLRAAVDKFVAGHGK